MVRKIRINESQLNRIITESVKKVISEGIEGDGKFSLAMHRLFSLMRDEIGCETIREDIASYFWLDWDGESKVVPCRFDDKGMFYMCYDLCNYDLITLTDNGVVDVMNSNHPDIAKLVKPYLSKENGLRIVHNLYGR